MQQGETAAADAKAAAAAGAGEGGGCNAVTPGAAAFVEAASTWRQRCGCDVGKPESGGMPPAKVSGNEKVSFMNRQTRPKQSQVNIVNFY